VSVENIVYSLRNRRFRKKTVIVLIAGCLLIGAISLILLVIAGVLAFTYHEQLYDGFSMIINYLFGDSPDNVLRGYSQQLADGFTKSLFSED
jgi:hypothetical protein